ncbi:vomeronasal type-2 receptor 26-like [Spea bombifrons]|uniref:vomeronasal type-2 receptor 26-like n=1 Tax=Spea bombifrons TaxID=233779 RepID=UPI0023491FBD|nr:vomeronasal type-2 receptor 26-like [Spea bombifrons]
MMLFFLLIVLFRILRTECSAQTFKNRRGLYRAGDLIIGAIVSVNGLINHDKPWSFKNEPREDRHIFAFQEKYQTLLTIIFAINEINDNPELLPNISLGFHLYDSFLNEGKTVDAFLRILTGMDLRLPNYRCTSQGRLVAVVGCASSRLSILVANAFGMYGYPQISYGSTDPQLSDKGKFPYFYRTVPNENHLYKAISLILKRFGWTWIGIIYSDDEINESAVQRLTVVITKNGGCIDFSKKFLSFFKYKSDEYIRMSETIAKSSATVILFWADLEFTFNFYLVLRNLLTSRKVWIIMTDMEHLLTPTIDTLDLSPFHGSLGFQISRRDVPGLMPFLLNATLEQHPESDVTYFFKILTYRCNRSRDYLYLDTCRHDLQQKKQLLGAQISLAGYRVYNAVYALAHALHDLLTYRCQKERDNNNGVAALCPKDVDPWQLHRFLKHIYFTNSAGEDVYFDQNGDVPPTYDLVNWIFNPTKRLTGVSVGIVSLGAAIEVSINNSEIVWPHYFTEVPPTSVCSETCPFGYRRMTLEGRPHCCYSCTPCPRGEITNPTDMDYCWKCPDDQWPNKRKDRCVSKPVMYLSYQEFLGASLASTTAILCLASLLTLGAFVYHQDTSVVKANNRSLSFLLLASLSLTFLSCLVFIGRPGKVTCFLRQTLFGICFTVSVSTLLAKTIIVVLAFHATKPGSKLRRCMGRRFPRLLVAFCSSLQTLICTTWLGTSPPFPFNDFQTQPGEIIIECREGLGLYVILSFIGFLAMASSIIAFLARKLPDAYNEAKLITFSMLVFFSVWVSFIPTYLSTTGKYMVAVEIFAIIGSSSGILVWIFFPKCYIILCKPDKARNANATRRHRARNGCHVPPGKIQVLKL